MAKDRSNNKASNEEPRTELVPFIGDDVLVGIRTHDGVAVGVRRICENLGLDASGQLRNLTTTHAHWSGVDIMSIRDARGYVQELSVIPLEKLPMWMACLNPGKVRPELREKIKRYQCEAADVLARHFFGQPARQPEIITPQTIEGISQLMNSVIELSGEVATLKSENNTFKQILQLPLLDKPSGYETLGDFAKQEGIPLPNQSAKSREAAVIRRIGKAHNLRGLPHKTRLGGVTQLVYPDELLNLWQRHWLSRNKPAEPRLFG